MDTWRLKFIFSKSKARIPNEANFKFPIRLKTRRRSLLLSWKCCGGGREVDGSLT